MTHVQGDCEPLAEPYKACQHLYVAKYINLGECGGHGGCGVSPLWLECVQGTKDITPSACHDLVVRATP